MSNSLESRFGQVLENTYRITRLIGEGGMGAVYEAEHSRLPRRFAVKMLFSQVAENAVAVERFHREALITSELGHPHIVDVIDFNHAPDGTPYIVMEMLEGEDLETRLSRVNRIQLQTVSHILEQTASALEAVHNKGIVHRDLKPQNIFLCNKEGSENYVKVVDFGISKIRGGGQALTRAHMVMGTPYYMSPEQARGHAEKADRRADIFALGVMLYEMLTGNLPFSGETPDVVLYQVVHEQPPPFATFGVDIPPAVEEVVLTAMAKNPEDRYATMADLSEAFIGAAERTVIDFYKVPDRKETDKMKAVDEQWGDPAAMTPAPSDTSSDGSMGLQPTSTSVDEVVEASNSVFIADELMEEANKTPLMKQPPRLAPPGGGQSAGTAPGIGPGAHTTPLPIQEMATNLMHRADKSGPRVSARGPGAPARIPAITPPSEDAPTPVLGRPATHTPNPMAATAPQEPAITGLENTETLRPAVGVAAGGDPGGSDGQEQQGSVITGFEKTEAHQAVLEDPTLPLTQAQMDKILPRAAAPGDKPGPAALDGEDVITLDEHPSVAPPGAAEYPALSGPVGGTGVVRTRQRRPGQTAEVQLGSEAAHGQSPRRNPGTLSTFSTSMGELKPPAMSSRAGIIGVVVFVLVGSALTFGAIRLMTDPPDPSNKAQGTEADREDAGDPTRSAAGKAAVPTSSGEEAAAAPPGAGEASQNPGKAPESAKTRGMAKKPGEKAATPAAASERSEVKGTAGGAPDARVATGKPPAGEGKEHSAAVSQKPEVRMLSVDSTPPGARVLINQQFVGVTPLKEYEAPIGRLHVVLARKDYRRTAQQVSAGKDPVNLTFTLEARPQRAPPRMGNLRVATVLGSGMPTRAVITINGKRAGESPLNISLPAGNHKVEAFLKGRKVGGKQARVTPDKTEVLILKLQN